MYRSLFSRDLFAELARLQSEMGQPIDDTPAIRGIGGMGRSGYPALNVTDTPTSIEIVAFAPGLDPAKIDVQIDRGVLTIDGERQNDQPAPSAKTSWHVAERFHGRFRRVVSVPDDIDRQAVTASYRDGLLHLSLPRRESAQPRRVAVQ